MKWWETQAGQERFEHDRALLTSHHPDLVMGVVGTRVEANGHLAIEVGESGMRLDYRLQMVFPTDYPKTAPTVFDAGNAFPHVIERHFMTNPDGACCFWLPMKPQWRAGDPDALLRFISEHVAPFFLRQYLFDEYGWLGPAYAHGWRAYLEYAEDEGVSRQQIVELLPAFAGWDQPGSPCPCGSGRPFGCCHREFVRSFGVANADDVARFLTVVGFEEAFRRVISGSDWHPWRLPL